MRKTLLALFLVLLLTFSASLTARAITWGVLDTGNQYPNVASVRGIVAATSTARISCSGSLLYADADKTVILTAAHCTDGWVAAIADGSIDSVGVSFDLNNQINGSISDGTYYVQGGVPFSYPAKDAPFERLDYGMVVFPASATNSVGETIAQRWPGLSPVQLPPGPDYLPDLIAGTDNPVHNLSFTAVGYGTGEKFPIPGQQTGPANPHGTNYDKFLKRYIADGMMYSAHNPVDDVLRLSMNIARGESGTCNGDSGGPIFYQDATLGRVQVSLVSGGDAVCRATNTGPGFSLQQAFDFLACGQVAGGVSDVRSCLNDLFAP